MIYKSQKLEEELNSAKNALNVLCGNVDKVENFYIEELDMYRKILIVNKTKVTPLKYPRDKNKPKLQPL